MIRFRSALRSRFAFNLSHHLTGLLLLLLLASASAHAQSTTALDGYTPTGLAPGAPTGSYKLSGFETVNLYNGGLNFNLPLVTVGGRGTASHQITRSIENKWIVEQRYDDFGQYYTYFPYQESSIRYNQDYGAGSIKARYAHWGTQTCPRGGGITDVAYVRTLTRLTFTAPGGTEFELRDQLSDGQYYSVGGCPARGTTYNRGKVFTTSDGTAATFISDTDITDGLIQDDPSWYADPEDINGYLLMQDGTRYRIDGGVVSSIRDRNGNMITWVTDGVTDSLNRKVTVTYKAAGGAYDEIKYKGTGGLVDRVIRVNYTPLASALRAGYTLQTPKQLFPELDGSSATNYNPQVIRSVVLPNGKSYTFSYNPYGELARVVLPTGGAIEYDWAAGTTNGNTDGAINFGGVFGGEAMDWEIYRRVIERRTYANGTTLESRTTFSRPETETTNGVGEVSVSTLGYVVVDQMDAAGALLGRQMHYYYDSAGDSLNNTAVNAVLAYPGWKEGKEWKTEEFDDDGTTVLRRVQHTWQQPLAGATWPLTTAETSDGAKTNDPQITQTVVTLVDTNKVSKQTFKYDQYSNRTDVYEYDYGNGVAGALVRRTATTYLTSNVVSGTTYNYDTDTSIHLRSLPAQLSVYNAAGVEQARTTFEYDNYTATAPHAALTARTGISGLDSAYTTSKKTRGNVTATTRYLLTSGTVSGSISAYRQYDVAGNVVKTIDWKNNATTYNFADRFGAPNAEAQSNSAPTELGTQSSYAFPTLVTNAMSHKVYVQRDYYTGQVVDAEDLNGMTSSAYYDDPLDRPTEIISAADDATQALTSQKTFSYDDTNRIVTTTSDLTGLGDNLIKGQIVYDGLGRAIETRQYETATVYVMTKRTYDALGRLNKVSNPYKTGQSLLWTTTAYDALGRAISVTTPDNAVATTAYSGNTVTATDQSGKDRQSTLDALGRLIQVVEDPGGLAYLTTYAYDTLDNLKTVTQTGLQNGVSVTETRTFTYDSLSRLVTAINPESGTVQYKYDANGNLVLKIDPRAGGASLPACSIPYAGTNIATCTEYDALNRPTSRDYNDSTPDVKYFYDAQGLPTGAPTFTRGASTGRLVAVTTGGTNAGSYYGYDGLGQVLKRIQRTDSVDYVSDATYNKAGGMLTETRPAVPGATDRRTITYNYDGAGRLLSLNSNATTYAAGASVSTILYAPHGVLDKETLGNGLVHDINYNTRLQPSQIRLGTTAAPTSVLDLTYNYGTTANNGNVLDVTEKISTWTRKQVYTYDALNRLDKTDETNGSTTTYWTEDNDYDRFGNRWEVISGGSPVTFNNKNRVVGYTYDLAGNVVNDTVRTYGYDAENRIKAVGTVTTAFVYDGEGRRVKKDFPLEEQVRFVYGVGGQLVMEINTASSTLKKEYVYGPSGLLATIEPVIGTRYVTPDHLGSPRAVTGATGTVISRHDYKPFGRELLVGDAGRTAAQFFGVDDGSRQKFTGYERDDETGLDFAQARYYSSQLGRFASTDPLLATGRTTMPQSWNRYTYVLNNPLSFTDSTGLGEEGGNAVAHPEQFLTPVYEEVTIDIAARPASPNPSDDAEDPDPDQISGLVVDRRDWNYEITYTLRDQFGRELTDASTQSVIHGGPMTPDMEMNPLVITVESDNQVSEMDTYHNGESIDASVTSTVRGQETKTDFTVRIIDNRVEVDPSYNNKVNVPPKVVGVTGVPAGPPPQSDVINPLRR